jgi:hypothetical protein
MIPLGYALVALANSAIVSRVGLALPVRLTVAGVGVCDFDKAGQVMPDAEKPSHIFVERVLQNEPPEALHEIASETDTFVGGRVLVTRVYNLLPAPIRQIDKAVILERLTDAQLEAALGMMTARQKERWRMPGRPAINSDDPEMLALLRAVGADPAVVLA